MSAERARSKEYPYQIWTLYLAQIKELQAQLKFMDNSTDRQMDRPETIYPDQMIGGHKTTAGLINTRVYCDKKFQNTIQGSNPHIIVCRSLISKEKIDNTATLSIVPEVLPY